MNSRSKLIPYPSYRMKVLRVPAILFKKFAEVKNEVIYSAGGRVNVVPPYNL